MENLDGIEKSLERKDVDKVKEILAQGKILITKRIKLIKIADREDWGTVNEYVSDDLAFLFILISLFKNLVQ